MTKTTRLSAFALGLSLLGAGCFKGDFQDGKLACGVGDACPSGYQCAAGYCYHNATAPLVDASVPPFYGSGQLGTVLLPAGTITINADTGAITQGSTTIIPAGSAGFQQMTQSNGVAVAVWNFDSVDIQAGATVIPVSSSPIAYAFAATSSINVAGTLDFSQAGGRGGAPGADGNGLITASVFQAGKGAAPDASGGGGGGAGHSVAGDSGLGTSGGAGGMAVPGSDPRPLQLGAGGGGGYGGPPTFGGNGGNGGGTIALLAPRVSVTGSILVDGSRGFGTRSNMPGAAGGGGGGSGGEILISADTLDVGGAATFSAKGGVGGTAVAGSGFDGGKGAVGRIFVRANSGTSTLPNSTPTPDVRVSPGSVITNFPE